jgi:hypothetical protein
MLKTKHWYKAHISSAAMKFSQHVHSVTPEMDNPLSFVKPTSVMCGGVKPAGLTRMGNITW